MISHGCFDEFFIDYIADFEQRQTVGILSEDIGRQLLTESLMAIASRTLISEFLTRYPHAADDPDGDDLYRQFAEDLTHPSVRAQIVRDYPELDRLLRLRVERTAALVDTCLHRLASDRDALIDLGLHPGELTGLTLSSGDSHNDGQRVLLLHGERGSLAYKPRSVDVDHLVGKIVDLLDDRDGPFRLAPLTVLARPGYGWQEFTGPRDCTTLDEVRRCFRSAGQWLGLFHSIGATDLHLDNVVADGEDLRFIDLETAIGHITVESTATLVTHLHQINRSVLGTMLLPGALANSMFDVSISGLGSGLSQRSPTHSTYRVDALGTNGIRFQKVSLEVTGQDNLVRLDGRVQTPMDFVDEIESGYAEAIDHIATVRPELVRLIADRPGTVVRRVLRPTAVYSRFLEASLHPKYLADRASRHDLLRLIEGTSPDRHEGDLPAVRRFEVDALEDLDVPYFSTRLGSRDLTCGLGSAIPDFLTAPPGDSLVDHLTRQAEARGRTRPSLAPDGWFNRSLIHQSMATTTVSEHDADGGSRFLLEAVSAGDPHDRAVAVADYLASTARADDLDPGYWITPRIMSETTWALDKSAPTLLDTGGAAAFLAECPDASARDRGHAYWARNAQTTFDEAIQRRDVSLFTGAASHLLLSSRLDPTRIDADATRPDLLEAAGAKAERPELPAADADFTYGLSGLGLVLTSLLGSEARSAWSGVAASCRSMIHDALVRGEHDGVGELAHGSMGLALGIVAWAELDDALDHGHVATARRLLDSTISGAEHRPVRRGWCRGQHGSLTASILAHQLLGFSADANHERHESWISDLWAGSARPQGSAIDISLCHGLAGEVDSWLTIDQVLGLGIADDVAARFEAAVSRLDGTGYTCGLPYSAGMPSYLMGISGFAHVGLRLGTPLPSLVMPHARTAVAA